MKCLDDCHTYRLDTVMESGLMLGVTPCRNCGSNVESMIGFYKMYPDGALVDGVTNEEVLQVLIHRLTILNQTFRCEENEDATHHLIMALSALDRRTRSRQRREVEGTHRA